MSPNYRTLPTAELVKMRDEAKALNDRIQQRADAVRARIADLDWRVANIANPPEAALQKIAEARESHRLAQNEINAHRTYVDNIDAELSRRVHQIGMPND